MKCIKLFQFLSLNSGHVFYTFSPEEFVFLDSDTFSWVLNAIVSDALFNGNKVGNGTFHFLKKKKTRPFHEQVLS